MTAREPADRQFCRFCCHLWQLLDMYKCAPIESLIMNARELSGINFEKECNELYTEFVFFRDNQSGLLG